MEHITSTSCTTSCCEESFMDNKPASFPMIINSSSSYRILQRRRNQRKLRHRRRITTNTYALNQLPVQITNDPIMIFSVNIQTSLVK
uniref:Uncharacterized protein n=1 Tax=Rhizophagus irregularis (strain DAOM 181602 / DAOM 197198 / MUCL 43194) TaxID=747089 RepID=U9T7E3_RHIID